MITRLVELASVKVTIARKEKTAMTGMLIKTRSADPGDSPWLAIWRTPNPIMVKPKPPNISMSTRVMMTINGPARSESSSGSNRPA